MIDRRAFVRAAVAVLTVTSTASAQPGGKLWRVAVASSTFSAATLRTALGDLGYVDGRNLILDHRGAAEGRVERDTAIIGELLARRPDVIVVAGPHGIKAAQKAAATVPIVVLDAESDPVKDGFVKSLARPGGNITGVFLDFPELAGKQLQFLQEALRGVTRVAVLWDPSVGRSPLEAIEAAAHATGITLVSLPVPRTEDLEDAIGRAGRERVKALSVLTSPMFIANSARIAELALKHRLPLMSVSERFVHAGGLMAYGPNSRAMWERVATYIDRILKGASPTELPVERPTKFELLINLKTAKTLGLTIPQSLLLRVDRAIQ